MPTADCQKSGVEGKVLGLHSTVFSESDNENTRLDNKNQSKKSRKTSATAKVGLAHGQEQSGRGSSGRREGLQGCFAERRRARPRLARAVPPQCDYAS